MNRSPGVPEIADQRRQILRPGQGALAASRVTGGVTADKIGLKSGRTMPPILAPLAFRIAAAALLRSDISLSSYSATAARISIVNRFASGMSAATKSAPLSISFVINATFLASRSSLAIASVAR